MDNPLRFIDPDGMSALYDCETCGPPISEQQDDNLDDELRGRDFLKDAMNKDIDKDIEKLSKVDIDFRDDPFYNPGNRPNPKPDRDQKFQNKFIEDVGKDGDGKDGNKKPVSHTETILVEKNEKEAITPMGDKFTVMAANGVVIGKDGKFITTNTTF